MWFKKEKQKEYIGEAYCGRFDGLSFRGLICPAETEYGPGQRVSKEFIKFNKED